MKKTNYLLLLLMVAALMIVSCKKGDQGPVGPKGDTGATGAAGANGAAGAKGATGAAGTNGTNGANGAKGATGATGTANVIYSDWVYGKNFRDTIADNSKLHIADVDAPKLTTDMLNSATILVYFNFGAGVYTLPYTSYAGSRLNTISFMPRFKHLIITRFTADNSNAVILSTLLQYRYIIIPGGISATAITNHLNVNDYDAVRNYYNIAN